MTHSALRPLQGMAIYEVNLKTDSLEERISFEMRNFVDKMSILCRLCKALSCCVEILKNCYLQSNIKQWFCCTSEIIKQQRMATHAKIVLNYCIW